MVKMVLLLTIRLCILREGKESVRRDHGLPSANRYAAALVISDAGLVGM